MYTYAEKTIKTSNNPQGMRALKESEIVCARAVAAPEMRELD